MVSPKDSTKYNTVQFDLNNPTSGVASFNLFDGWSLTPTPNTPYGFDANYNGELPYPIPQNTYPKTVVSNKIFSPYLNNWGSVYVPTTKRVYSVAFDGERVFIIDPITNNQVNSISLSIGVGVFANMLYNPINNKVYVINQSNSISVIDCVTETEIAVYSYSEYLFTNLTLDTSKNSIYLTTNGGAYIFEFNVGTNSFSSVVSIPNICAGIQFYSYAGNNYIIVFSPEASFAYLINTATNTVVSSIALSEPSDTYGSVAYDTDKNTIYFVSNINSLHEYDISTASLLLTNIIISQPISDILYVADYKKLYIAILSSKIYIIDTTSNTITTNISVSLYLSTTGKMAYDSDIFSLFVNNSDGATYIKLNDLTLVPYIVGGITDYNLFIQSQKNDPKCVRQLVVVVDKNHMDLFYQPLNLTTRDANGNLCIVPNLPNIEVGANQFQGGLSYIDFKCPELIFDNQTIISNYTIPPFSIVKLVLAYSEIKKSEMLLGAYKNLCNQEDGATCSLGDVNERTEKQIKEGNPKNYTPMRVSHFYNDLKNIVKHSFEPNNCDTDKNTTQSIISREDYGKKKGVSISASELPFDIVYAKSENIKNIGFDFEPENCGETCQGNSGALKINKSEEQPTELNTKSYSPLKVAEFYNELEKITKPEFEPNNCELEKYVQSFISMEDYKKKKGISIPESKLPFDIMYSKPENIKSAKVDFEPNNCDTDKSSVESLISKEKYGKKGTISISEEKLSFDIMYSKPENIKSVDSVFEPENCGENCQ